MGKEEILKYLKNNIQVFDNVAYGDFCLLASLDSNELGLMNNYNYKVTPLLKQICDYAMIASFLEETEINELITVLTLKKEEQILLNALNIVTECYKYIDLIVTEECHHPSVLNFMNIMNCSIMYSNIFDIACDLLEMLDDDYKEDLIDLSDEVDEKILDVIYSFWQKLLKDINDNGIDNEKELLEQLTNYVKNKSIVCSLIKNNNISYDDDCYIRIANEKIKAPGKSLSIGDSLKILSDIIIKSEIYKEDSSDDEIIELISELNEAYYLYNYYRYYYLKNGYQEKKMLEKCKKM